MLPEHITVKFRPFFQNILPLLNNSLRRLRVTVRYGRKVSDSLPLQMPGIIEDAPGDAKGTRRGGRGVESSPKPRRFDHNRINRPDPARTGLPQPPVGTARSLTH